MTLHIVNVIYCVIYIYIFSAIKTMKTSSSYVVMLWSSYRIMRIVFTVKQQSLQMTMLCLAVFNNFLPNSDVIFHRR